MNLDRIRRPKRDDLVLALWAAALGVAGSAAFAAYRAVSVSGEDAQGRIVEFVSNALWPGVLIFAGIAGAVIVGWKANLD